MGSIEHHFKNVFKALEERDMKYSDIWDSIVAIRDDYRKEMKECIGLIIFIINFLKKHKEKNNGSY
jgi:hypothetical protein